MPKYPLTFVEFHNPLFMNGTNLGNKLNGPFRGATLLMDDDRQVVWVHYKGKTAFVPLASVASADAVTIPDDVTEAMGLNTPQELSGPPAVKRGRGRPPMEPIATPSIPVEAVPMPTHDPNDMVAAAEHRARVRAASANANKPQFVGQQNDDLIQASRAAAMGIKHNKGAQVQTAQQVGEAASVVGKKKPLSHAELKAMDPNK